MSSVSNKDSRCSSTSRWLPRGAAFGMMISALVLAVLAVSLWLLELASLIQPPHLTQRIFLPPPFKTEPSLHTELTHSSEILPPAELATIDPRMPEAAPGGVDWKGAQDAKIEPIMPGTAPLQLESSRETLNAHPPRPDALPAKARESFRPQQKRIVLVIDDAGYNLQDLEPFLAFPGPLVIAVLPRLPYSEESARRAKAKGKEVVLHQPMEALGGEYPGLGAIRLGMSDQEIKAVIAANLATVPGAVGINNHMGSAVTQDPQTMRAVLKASRSMGLYFLDSLTTSDSVVNSVASQLNLRIWERDVFLDHYPDRAAILRKFDQGIEHAEKEGLAIMIGHVQSPELAQIIVELYPVLIELGFSFSTISCMIRSVNDTGY